MRKTSYLPIGTRVAVSIIGLDTAARLIHDEQTDLEDSTMNAALFDPADDLSRYTTAQLRAVAGYLESELLRIVSDGESVDSMTAIRKRKIADAVAYLNRVSAEIMRRESLPLPGPSAIHYEVLPDGSGPVRLSFTVLAF